MKRHLIGLGFRCDVAFQLRMHGSENVAHFFDWLATPQDGLIKIIKSDFDVFYPDHLDLKTDHIPHCVVDKVTGTVFHHQFPLYAGHVQPDFLLYYDVFIQKFRYLAARFRDYMQTRPVTLVRQGINREQALLLEEAVLERFPQADVQFLYIVNDGAEFQTPYGRARLLKSDGSSLGIPEEWARVLGEEGLIDLPYRHATVEILGAAHDDHNLSTDNRFSEEQLLIAMQTNVESSFFPLELARLYEIQNKWQKSEDSALIALARKPGDAMALFQVTLAQWRLNKIPANEAAKIFQKVLGRTKPPTSWMRTVSAAMLAADNAEEALRYANMAVCADPTDQRNYLQKASCLYHKYNLPDTELALAAAMRLGPLGTIYRHMFANILDWRGDSTAAEQVELEIVQNDPKFFPSLFHLSALLMKDNRYTEALNYCYDALPVSGLHRAAVEKRIVQLIEKKENIL